MTGLPNEPWGHLWADLFGLFLSKEYILVVQCLCSCFSAVEIVPSTSASAIIRSMGKILTNFGIPYKPCTDNCLPFNSQYFANLAKLMGLEHTTGASHATWANSTVIHFMRNLGNVLKTWHIDEHNRKTALQRFCSFLQGHVTLHLRVPTSVASIQKQTIQKSTAIGNNQRKPFSIQGSPRKRPTSESRSEMKGRQQSKCEDHQLTDRQHSLD